MGQYDCNCSLVFISNTRGYLKSVKQIEILYYLPLINSHFLIVHIPLFMCWQLIIKLIQFLNPYSLDLIKVPLFKIYLVMTFSSSFYYLVNLYNYEIL